MNILKARELADSNFINAFIKLILITLYDNIHNDETIADTTLIIINKVTVFLLYIFENILIISLDISIKTNIKGNKKVSFIMSILKNAKYSLFIFIENIFGDKNKSDKNIIAADILIIELYRLLFLFIGFGRLSKSIVILEISIFLFEINTNINVTNENANNNAVKISLDVLSKLKASLFITILIIDEATIPSNVEDNTIFNTSL